jgi:acetyltransferase-like isoleucine patch superfamily enzyme
MRLGVGGARPLIPVAWRKVWGFVRAWLMLHFHGFAFAGTPMFFGRRPILVTGGQVRLGQALRVNSLQVPAMFGASPGGELVMGDSVYMNQGVNIVARTHIHVGDNVRFADLATVYDHPHHLVDVDARDEGCAVHIGSNVWIGRNALILPGVEIGDGAVVAAGSVVSKSVRPRVLVAGIPAREIRELNVPNGWIR